MITVEYIDQLSKENTPDITILSRPIIIFGAGVIGKMTADALLNCGIIPKLFLDENPSSKKYKDIPIKTPQSIKKAEDLKLNAVIIIAILDCVYYHDFHLNIIGNKLKKYGFIDIWYYEQFMVYLSLNFPNFKMGYVKGDMQNLYKKNLDQINRVFSLLCDKESKNILDTLLKFNLSAKLEYLDLDKSLVNGFPQYFLCDLFDLDKVKVYFDLGAFNGDTLISAIENCKNLHTAYCFEPSDEPYNELVENSKNVNIAVHCLPFSCSNKTGISYYYIDDKKQYHISHNQDIAVGEVKLDDMFSRILPDLIKLDIEGAEEAAIIGAKELIKSSIPVIAVCVYHKPDDIWKLTTIIDDLVPETYSFYLRRTFPATWIETVLYAVPKKYSKKTEHIQHEKH